MVTGDNVQTARAIALECGILGSDSDATEPNLIEGKVFRALSDAQREEVAEKISVRVLDIMDPSSSSSKHTHTRWKTKKQFVEWSLSFFFLFKSTSIPRYY